MRIKRASTGSTWFIVQDTADGREIIHGRRDDLDAAITYLRDSLGAQVPTIAERATLMREDQRVRFRQRFRRMPTEDELTAVLRDDPAKVRSPTRD